MKKIIFLLTLCAVIISASAQSDKYVKAMEAKLATMDTTHSTPGLKSLSDAFLRIAEAEKTQWLPYYYSALCLVNIGWTDPKMDKDANAEKIKALCSSAEAIENNAELCSIRNMAATQQMLVDPQSRWSTYGAEGEAAMKKGLQLDPNNPRLYYLMGAGIFGTPEQFGGGKAKAKPILQKAVSLFNNEQPKALYPRWGKKLAEEMLAKCD